MKTPFTIAMVFCFMCFETIAQDNQEIVESYFGSKTLAVFENDLKLSSAEKIDPELSKIVHTSYQEFFTTIHTQLNSGKPINATQFESAYEATVLKTKTRLFGKKPTPSNPPEPTKILNGPCINMDFEAGDLSGWELSRGDVDGSAPYSYINELLVGPSIFHSIFGAGVDPVTGIPTVNPAGGGSFSTRLGDGTGVGARGARMKQTFLVDANNYLYTYSYAVIFESPAGHGLNALPYFTVRVFDQNGASVPCGEYSVIADAANAVDYQNTNFGGSVILYKNWQTVFTNLSAYIGQNVTIEFTTGDCSLSGHYTYAYIDASCNMAHEITASNPLICAGDSAVLTAPAGAAQYNWSNGATTQSTTIFAGGNYTCTLTPFQGAGCSLTLNIVITENPSPTAGFTQNTTTTCVNTPVIFTDASTIPNPGVITNYQWDFGDGTTTAGSNGNINGVANTSGTFINPTHTYTVAGVYSVRLVVLSADGCSDTILQQTTINALPIVVAGVDQTACENVPVTLSGSGATSYVWSNGISNGIAFIQAVGITNYTVTGTDANGCQNTDQVSVEIYPLPIVNAGVDQEVCENTSITLTATGAINYAWNNGATNGVTFVPAVGTINYTVTGTDGNGCQNTDQLTVMVNPLPIVNAGPDQTVCENTPVTLSGSGAQTYVWNNGVINNTPFISPVGTTVYTAIGTDIKGCQNSDQVSILVHPLPIVSAGPDQTVCENITVTLTASGAVNYNWTNGITNGVPFIQLVGSMNYTVTGTDANGCQNTDIATILVNPLPNPNAGPNMEYCENTWITVNYVTPNAISWNNNITNGIAFQQAVGTQLYILTETLATGCTNQDTLQIIVHPNPIVSANDMVICDGNPAILNGSGASNYAWSDGIINGMAFYPSSTSTFMVIGMDNEGCIDTAFATVTVNPLPIVDFNILNFNLTTVDPTTGFDNLSNGVVSYTWDFGDGEASTLFEPTHTFPDNNTGDYTITLTGVSAEGCPATRTKYIHVFRDYTIFVPNTFTPDGDGNNDFFFPVMEGFDPNKYVLYIFNRWGQIIFESHEMGEGWDGRFHSDNPVEDGVYTWKIEAKILDSADTKMFVGHVTILQ